MKVEIVHLGGTVIRLHYTNDTNAIQFLNPDRALLESNSKTDQPCFTIIPGCKYTGQTLKRFGFKKKSNDKNIKVSPGQSYTSKDYDLRQDYEIDQSAEKLRVRYDGYHPLRGTDHALTLLRSDWVSI